MFNHSESKHRVFLLTVEINYFATLLNRFAISIDKLTILLVLLCYFCLETNCISPLSCL